MNNKLYILYVHISPDDKVYFGVTCQKPNRRWRNGEGYRSNPYFYNAIQKYGWCNFSHIILLNGLTEIEAKRHEVELINLYESNNRLNGYNLTSGGDGVRGYQHSEKHKKELSIKMSGKGNHMYGVSLNGLSGKDNPMHGKTGALNPNSRRVICITTGEVFGSVREGARKYGTYGSDINKCAKGVRKYAGKLNGVGLEWRYPNDV